MTIDGLAAMKRSRDEASEKAKKRNSARHASAAQSCKAEAGTSPSGCGGGCARGRGRVCAASEGG